MNDNPSGHEMRARMTWGAGLAIGIGVGVALGAGMKNMAAGLAIGIAIGVLFVIGAGMIGRKGGASAGSDASEEAPDASDTVPGDEPPADADERNEWWRE